jgi:UDP-N-acetylglucosamine 2-epimerase
MSDTFFRELNIPAPDHLLNIGSGTHGKQTGAMLEAIEVVLTAEKPDAVIVYGDTNTTLAGALASVKMHIPVFHVEAGLRSNNRSMPEEINRIVADHTADYLFAPTENAMGNLRLEGLTERAYLTGDIMVDVLNDSIQYANLETLRRIGVQAEEYYLMTLHRPYNVDKPDILINIINSIGKLDLPVVFPVHPRTHKMIDRVGEKYSDQVKMIDPVGYIDFLLLQYYAKKIITDSGGVQKEAYLLKKPCITLRSETEWVETVEVGWNMLINPQWDIDIDKLQDFRPPANHPSLFVENVAVKMAEEIKNILCNTSY